MSTMNTIKTLQVPVITGEGEGQFFVEKDTRISPPSPPVFKIKEIKKRVEIITAKVIRGKVIFNALLWKTVVYTTVEHVHDETVNGPVFHSTFRIPFGGFVELHPFPGEKVKEGDKAELLEAEIEGSKDILHDERCVDDIKVFNKLLEKTVVRLKFKATKIEHVTVKTIRKPPHACEDDESLAKEDKCDEEALTGQDALEE